MGSVVPYSLIYFPRQYSIGEYDNYSRTQEKGKDKRKKDRKGSKPRRGTVQRRSNQGLKREIEAIEC